MGVLLALRRLQTPDIAAFLDDPDLKLAREAARAIYDTPIAAALPALAARIERSDVGSDAPLLRRVINAAARQGTPEHAAGLARLAARREVPESIRVEALQILAAWADPPGIDRVTGLWRPTPARPAGDASVALTAVLPGLLHDAPEPVRLAALRALGPIRVAGTGTARCLAPGCGRRRQGSRGSPGRGDPGPGAAR